MSSRNRSFLDRHWKAVYASVSLLLDSGIVYGSLVIGYFINFSGFSLEAFLAHQWKLVAYSIVLYGGLNATFGVYRQAYTSPMRLQLAAALRAYIPGTLIVFATLFLFRNTYYSNGALLTYGLVLPIAFLSERVVLNKLRSQLHKTKRGLEPAVVVLIDGAAAAHVQNLASPSSGLNVLAVADVSTMDDQEARQSIKMNIALYDPLYLMVIVTTLDSLRLSVMFRELLSIGIPIRLSSPEVHDALTRTRLYDFAGVVVLHPKGATAGTIQRVMKRAFDVLVSGVFILASAPILILIALAIQLESAGGVLFRQLRSLAPHSKPVRVFKFRSMKSDGVEGEKESKTNVHRVPSKSPLDPRITRVGRFIRKYSLDEFPQLFNVLMGEMSLVGPRPLPASDFKKLPSVGAAPFLYDQRARVKPGLTGLWQISGRSGLNYQQMVILDLYYAEHQTFLFDLEILLETIPAVISGRGAY